MRYVFTADARRDLASIRDYLMARDELAARKVIEAIFAAARRAALFPESGRPGEDQRVREMVLTKYPYLLQYRAENDQVIIVRIFHTAQDR